jgi:hypothetical protein
MRGESSPIAAPCFGCASCRPRTGDFPNIRICQSSTVRDGNERGGRQRNDAAHSLTIAANPKGSFAIALDETGRSRKARMRMPFDPAPAKNCPSLPFPRLVDLSGATGGPRLEPIRARPGFFSRSGTGHAPAGSGFPLCQAGDRFRAQPCCPRSARRRK